MNPHEKIDALLALISSAAHDAVADYEKRGYEVPSLSSSKAHPTDSEVATLALKKSIRVLEGACEQLCTTLAPTTHTSLNRSMQEFETVCMRIAIQAGIADTLLDHDDGLHVDKLAEKAGLEPTKLSRILRLLATRNCFREVQQDVFANNRLSLTLVRSPTSDCLLLTTGMILDAAQALPNALRDPEFGHSKEPSKSSYMYHIRDEKLKDYFDYLNVYPEEGKLFASAMIGWSKLTDGLAIVQDFPWGELPPGTKVCDVGGGVGHIMIGLAKAYPNLKLTLQDQPSVIEQAHSLWDSECPLAVNEGRIDFVPFDFFKEGPVKDQDIYYATHVLHDWPDAESVKILQSIRQSMKPESRIFIHEYALRLPGGQEGSDTPGEQLAPEPLLPNYGSGTIRQYYQDLNMMVLGNAKERTLIEFKALGVKAGLQFVQVWEFAENGMIEFRLP